MSTAQVVGLVFYVFFAWFAGACMGHQWRRGPLAGDPDRRPGTVDILPPGCNPKGDG
jgi:hypothetical protein